jgi:hypothetical protein
MKRGKKEGKRKYLSKKKRGSSGESSESGKFRIVVDEETQIEEFFREMMREIFTPAAAAKLISVATGRRIDEKKIKRIERPEITIEFNVEVDLLLQIGNELLHIEIEEEYDETLPERMYECYCAIYEKYGKEPIQVVLFIGEGKPPPDTFKSGPLTLKYRVIDVKKEMPELYQKIKDLLQ